MNGPHDHQLSEFVPNVNLHTGTYLRKYPSDVFLYGLFNSRGKCRYVGQTVDLAARARFHEHTTGLRFRVLRICRAKDSSRLESQIIKAYKARGLCQLNKRLKSPPSRSRPGTWLVWKETGMKFCSKGDAGRYFGVTIRSITNWMSPNSYVYNSGIRLEKISKNNH